CIGNTFELSMLSVISEQSERETAEGLWTAVREDLIVPLSESYQLFHEQKEGEGPSESDLVVRKLISDRLALKKRGERVQISFRFLHDRVQQAAYALIPESQRKAEHLKIGRLLLDNMAPERLDEELFNIVTHLNRGRELLTDPGEKLQLATLNYQAGR